MAREFDGPLTAEDLAYLRARHTEAYVQRQVDLLGLADSAEEAENSPETPDEGADGDSGQNGGDDSGDGSDGSEEDLIGEAPGDENTGNAVGTTYNPGDHTVEEVNRHLKTVSDEERNAILALERDGRNRSSIDGI